MDGASSHQRLAPRDTKTDKRMEGTGIAMDHDMTLTKLIELQAAATTGPWEVRYEHPEVRTIAYIKAPGRILEVCTIFGCDGVNEETSNAELIEAARNFDFAALDAKIKRYEDALRFYSDNWQSNSTGDHTVPGGFMSWQEPNDDLIADEGERARKALEGMEC